MEQSFFFWINRDWANPVLDIFFKWISSPMTFSVPVFLMVFILSVRKFGRDGVFIFLLLLVAVGTGDFAGGVLKKIAGEPRPCYDMPEQVRRPGHSPGEVCKKGESTGMPSNHTLNFSTLAAFMAVTMRSWRWAAPLLVVAVTVGISRIYLGAHYPHQVAAGALFGILTGAAFAASGLWRFGFMKKAAGLRSGESGGPDPD